MGVQAVFLKSGICISAVCNLQVKTAFQSGCCKRTLSNKPTSHSRNTHTHTRVASQQRFTSRSHRIKAGDGSTSSQCLLLILAHCLQALGSTRTITMLKHWRKTFPCGLRSDGVFLTSSLLMMSLFQTSDECLRQQIRLTPSVTCATVTVSLTQQPEFTWSTNEDDRGPLKTPEDH